MFEEYLARNVSQFPEEAAKLYRSLYNHARDDQHLIVRAEARTILETAAAYGGIARADALATIDGLARRGFYNFRDIYDAYTFGPGD